jgi:hypothetical protein
VKTQRRRDGVGGDKEVGESVVDSVVEAEGEGEGEEVGEEVGGWTWNFRRPRFSIR